MLGVAPLPFRGGRFERQLDKLRAEAFDLFLRRRAHIVCFDHRTEPLGRRNRL